MDEPGVKYVPVHDFPFPQPSNTMFNLTCKNHTELLYLTKNPYSRNLHFVGSQTNIFAHECDCPFEDLVVVVKDEQQD